MGSSAHGHSGAHGHDGGGAHHIIPLKVYYRIIVALLIMTVVTVAAAQVDFGAMNTVIAMLIASVKAGLVLAYFMHLKYDDKIFTVAFGTAIFFLIVMFFFSWVDIFTRFGVDPVL
jgi:cytochrome c oxidase subunit IV